MQYPILSRRAFVRRTFGAAAIAGSLHLLPASPAARAARLRDTSVRLGGPLAAKADDPDAFAQAHRQLGYRAAYCPNLSLNDSDRIRAFAAACAKHNLVIAEVGRWCNLLHADPDQRRKNLQQVTEGLALAEAVGARCCVDIAGSFNPTSWFGPHPDNFSPKFFDAAVQNARQIIDAVKPKRAKFSYEMMGWAIPESPDRYRQLIKAVDRPAFAVHLDPCNLINSPEKYYRNADLLDECFKKLGPHIVSCHAKDLTWDIEMNVHFREVRPGAGCLDYTRFLQHLARLPQQPPLMLEHLPNPEEYDKARQFILERGRQIGVSFS